MHVLWRQYVLVNACTMVIVHIVHAYYMAIYASGIGRSAPIGKDNIRKE